jgi:hypothetical protein
MLDSYDDPQTLALAGRVEVLPDPGLNQPQ